jgi:hypothetical protein
VEPAALKGWKGESFYTILQKLAIGNQPVETGTPGFRIGTSSFSNIAVTGQTGHSGLETGTYVFPGFGERWSV